MRVHCPLSAQKKVSQARAGKTALPLTRTDRGGVVDQTKEGEVDLPLIRVLEDVIPHACQRAVRSVPGAEAGLRRNEQGMSNQVR